MSKVLLLGQVGLIAMLSCIICLNVNNYWKIFRQVLVLHISNDIKHTMNTTKPVPFSRQELMCNLNHNITTFTTRTKQEIEI